MLVLMVTYINCTLWLSSFLLLLFLGKPTMNINDRRLVDGRPPLTCHSRCFSQIKYIVNICVIYACIRMHTYSITCIQWVCALYVVHVMYLRVFAYMQRCMQIPMIAVMYYGFLINWNKQFLFSRTFSLAKIHLICFHFYLIVSTTFQTKIEQVVWW